MTLYESEVDRIAEAELAARAAGHLGLTPTKLDKRYEIDFALLDARERVRHFLEAKCRRNRSREQYPYSMLNMRKMMTGCRMAQLVGGAFIIAFEFTDGDFALNGLDVPRPWPLRVCGRTDRGEPLDKQPAVIIENDAFLPFAELPHIIGVTA